jgi:hypothetical protein
MGNGMNGAVGYECMYELNVTRAIFSFGLVSWLSLRIVDVDKKNLSSTGHIIVSRN